MSPTLSPASARDSGANSSSTEATSLTSGMRDHPSRGWSLRIFLFISIVISIGCPFFPAWGGIIFWQFLQNFPFPPAVRAGEKGTVLLIFIFSSPILYGAGRRLKFSKKKAGLPHSFFVVGPPGFEPGTDRL